MQRRPLARGPQRHAARAGPHPAATDPPLLCTRPPPQPRVPRAHPAPPPVANAAFPPALGIRPQRPRLPRPPAPQPETPPDQIAALLSRLDGAKAGWVAVGAPERAGLLRECLANALALAREFAEVSTETKGGYEGGLGDEM